MRFIDQFCRWIYMRLQIKAWMMEDLANELLADFYKSRRNR